MAGEISIAPNPAANQYYDPALVGPPVSPALDMPPGWTPPSAVSRNPMLPQSPLGAYTDAAYQQALAARNQAYNQDWQNTIGQLGYTDDQGNYIPGSVEVNANRQISDLQNSLRLADEATTNQMRDQGTLFSGYRGTAQARAEYPYAQGIASLLTDTPNTLMGLYNHLASIYGDYTSGNLADIAAAAERGAAALTKVPPAPAPGAGPSDGGAQPGTPEPGTPFTPGIPGSTAASPYADPTNPATAATIARSAGLANYYATHPPASPLASVGGAGTPVAQTFQPNSPGPAGPVPGNVPSSIGSFIR